jgi:hypothetical protein
MKAKALSKFIRPNVAPETFNRLQIAEYYGLSPKYHCKAHQTLVTNREVSLQAFADTLDLGERKRVAEAEMMLWSQYIKERMTALPHQFRFDPELLYRLNRIWKRVSGRSTFVEAKDFLEYFTTYNEYYPGKFPFDQYAIVSMLHPIRGHLTRLPGKFTYDQFLDFLKMETLASYERFVGEQLMAKQISAFNLWTFFDNNRTGYLGLEKFKKLMHVFYIEGIKTVQDLETELAWTLKSLPQELEGMTDQDAVLRFELAKRVFIDRNE